MECLRFGELGAPSSVPAKYVHERQCEQRENDEADNNSASERLASSIVISRPFTRLIGVISDSGKKKRSGNW